MDCVLAANFTYSHVTNDYETRNTEQWNGIAANWMLRLALRCRADTDGVKPWGCCSSSAVAWAGLSVTSGAGGSARARCVALSTAAEPQGRARMWRFLISSSGSSVSSTVGQELSCCSASLQGRVQGR